MDITLGFSLNEDIIAPAITDLLGMVESLQQGFKPFVRGLIVLITLLIVANILKFIIGTVLKRAKVNEASQKIGLSDTLGKLGITAPISKVVSTLVFWMIAIYAIKAASDTWQIADVSNFVQALMLFIPKLLVATFILFGGLLAADMVKKAIHRGLDNIGIEYGGLIGTAIYALLAVMIMTVVLGQLGIQTDLLNSTVKILVAAIGLAIALSLGLGLRPVAQNIVSGVYARDLFPPGSVLEIDDTMAVVREVGAVATRLESDSGNFVVIPNSTLVTQVNKGMTSVQQYSKKI